MEFCTKFHKLLEHLKSKILNISVDKIVRNQYLRINNYIYVMFIRYDNPPPLPYHLKETLTVDILKTFYMTVGDLPT